MTVRWTAFPGFRGAAREGAATLHPRYVIYVGNVIYVR
jgi:hypothetical protein